MNKITRILRRYFFARLLLFYLGLILLVLGTHFIFNSKGVIIPLILTLLLLLGGFLMMLAFHFHPRS